MGLSSEEAFDRFFAEARATILECKSSCVRKQQPACQSRYFCTRIFIYGRVALGFLLLGAVDIENEISRWLTLTCIVLLAFSGLLQFWQSKVRKTNWQFNYRKTCNLIETLERNRPKTYEYQLATESATEDFVFCQETLRDGKPCEVPRLLLVAGDVILLRPGQVAPCDCETSDGVVVKEGGRLDRTFDVDPLTHTVTPLDHVMACVTSYPIREHLVKVLAAEEKPLLIDYQMHHTIHHVFERILVPITVFLAVFGTVVRFFYADDESLFGTRFIFAVPSLALLPLLVFPIPLLLHVVKQANNKAIFDFLNIHRIDAELPTKDLVAALASITGTSIVDKKGIMSSTHPSIEKTVFVNNYGEISQSDPTARSGLNMEVLNLSSDLPFDESNHWSLSFEDPSWNRFLSNLRPLAHNLLLNSCAQSTEFNRFLDHLTVVSQNVPRTIATASRRCMCQFPLIVGLRLVKCLGDSAGCRFSPTGKCVEQFSSQPPSIVGFYKRQPGEAPLPGLTKHRTPIEMAFCTVHNDDKSLHSHLCCQGTANLVLDACTHAWDGSQVVPLSKRIIVSAKDFYQRYSMTGHCLAVSYRPVFSPLHKTVKDKYVEMPLNQDDPQPSTAIPRSHSVGLLKEDCVMGKPLETATDIVNEYFSGHVLCGLMVLQYEALPVAVQFIEKLDWICVRPVYFSKENELRSRVFAEKLGIEAGWNCHISLADEEVCPRQEDIANEQFIDQKPQRSNFWNRLAMSDTQLHSLDCVSLMRSSPTIRKNSVVSVKVGPIPNKARLPKGIANVRPHLDEVDNVPLLVGLFTDATTSAVEDMIGIMQENGEAVMVVGSSRNIGNGGLFVKANVSICVDPIDEPACRMTTAVDGHAVNDMAGKLVALAADFHMNHNSLLLLPPLIVACRHRMASVRSSLLFILYASCLLSLLLISSVFLFLPIIFAHAQVLLTTMLQIPLLFIGTLFTNFQPRHSVIRIAPKNRDEISKSEKAKIVTTFFVQYLPTAVFLIAMFFFLLVRNANLMCSFADVVCNFNTNGRTSNETSGYESLSTDSIRHVIGFHFVVSLCVLSSAHVFSLSSFWTDLPFSSRSWNLAVLSCLILQVGFSYASGVLLHETLSVLPSLTLVVWVLLLVVVDELFKIRCIRQFAREQRRTKFDFDTKLGMNSPY